MLLETADSVFLFSLFPDVAFCLLGFVFILLDIQQPLKSLNLLLGKPGHQFFKQGSSLHPCTVTSEIPTTGIWKPMDLAFTAQLSSRTSISGSQLSAPEFPSAISQFITLFFSYTEVQCVKSTTTEPTLCSLCARTRESLHCIERSRMMQQRSATKTQCSQINKY